MILTHTVQSIPFVAIFTLAFVGPVYVITPSIAAALVLPKGALINVCIRARKTSRENKGDMKHSALQRSPQKASEQKSMPEKASRMTGGLR